MQMLIALIDVTTTYFVIFTIINNNNHSANKNSQERCTFIAICLK
jgi:hypothetical protein